MISPTVKRRVKRLILWMEVLLILILGAGMGVVLGAFYQIHKVLPPDAVLDHYRPPVGTKIISSDGTVLAKLAAENREPVTLDRIPADMQHAIVAIEDSRFYSHAGLDFRGLARALWADVAQRDAAQGASTITQQLARNMFLNSQKKLSRKIKEMLLAVQIEKNWTKDQILNAYLNQGYFGSGAYGVKAAAQTYFGKDVSKLTLEESAMLAGLPQRPSEFSPYACFEATGKYDRTKNRRNMVLQRMADLGFITPDRAQKAKQAPIKVAKQKPRTTGFFRAKYMCQYVLDQLRDKYGYDEDVIDKAGLTVVTSLNWKMQQIAERVAREELKKIRRSNNVTETSLICIDPHTGYIRAMVGGVNQPWEKYQFNCAVQATRQTGSSFKAFVYTTAFEEGGKNPGSMVAADARGVRMPDGTWYAPKNHERTHYGTVNYTKAFALSLNGAAFNVCQDVGPRKVADMAKRMGIKEHIPAYPSIALGVVEIPPIEMASAYGVLATHGKLAEPIGILQIRNQENDVLEDAQPKVHDVGLKAQTFDYMDQLTRAVVTSGTGNAANIVPDAHGKTGTTEDYTDAWFVGYTPDLVTAVWAGNRNNKPMARVYGATIGVPIWAGFMKEAVELNPAKKKRPAPPVAKAPEKRKRKHNEAPVAAVGQPFVGDTNDRNLIRARVCTETGMLATANCPDVETEEFMVGELPPRCTVHTGKKTDKKPHPKKPDENDTGGDAAKEPAGNKADGQ